MGKKVWEHDCTGNVWLDGYGNQEHCFGDAKRGLCVSIEVANEYRRIFDDDTTFIMVDICPFCGKTAEETKGQVADVPKESAIIVIPSYI